MVTDLRRLVDVKDRRVNAAQSVYQRAVEMCNEARQALDEQHRVCRDCEETWASSRRGLLEDPRCRNYATFEQASRHAERLREELSWQEEERERKEQFVQDAERFLARARGALLAARRAKEKMLRQSDCQIRIERAEAAQAEDRETEDYLELLASRSGGRQEQRS